MDPESAMGREHEEWKGLGKNRTDTIGNREREKEEDMKTML